MVNEMLSTSWTHPQHKIPACMALSLNVISWILISVAVFGTPWFCNRRGSITECSWYLNFNVECSSDICRLTTSAVRSKSAGWQTAFEYIWVLCFVITGTSVTLQVIFFWPLVMYNKVMNAILILAYILDFCSGVMKAIVCFGTLLVSSSLNHEYAWSTQHAIGIELLPPALGLFSMILSFLAVVMLRVATDVGPLGGEPYQKTFAKERELSMRLTRLSKTHSFYVPRTDWNRIQGTQSDTGSTQV